MSIDRNLHHFSWQNDVFPILRLHAAELLHKLPKISFGPIRDILLQPVGIFLSVRSLDPLEVLRLPMEAHEPTDEQLCAIFRSLRESLVEKQRVADRTIQDAVEDVGKRLTLRLEVRLGRI